MHKTIRILGAIIGYAETIEMFEAPEGSRIRESLAEMIKAAYRARDLVRRILTFSRQSEAVLKPLIPGPIVKEALKFLRASLPAFIEIHQDVEETKDAVLADPTQMHQVITDMTMPGMAGDELARKMMDTRPDVPVILCTGYSDRISEEKAKSYGIRKFMMKPVGSRQLAEAVRGVLDRGKEPIAAVSDT